MYNIKDLGNFGGTATKKLPLPYPEKKDEILQNGNSSSQRGHRRGGNYEEIIGIQTNVFFFKNQAAVGSGEAENLA